ncbi:hypothetical protein [Comamonas sp. C24C]
MEDILSRKIKIYKHRCTSYWEQKFLLDRVPSGWEVEKIEEKKSLACQTSKTRKPEQGVRLHGK